MSKILTPKEMLQIMEQAVDGGEICCGDAYQHFLEDVGAVIADHFGGIRGTVEFCEEIKDYTVAFQINECVPEDGGVYKDFDPDVTWSSGEEL